MRGVKRFNQKGKLAPRYVSPFKILERHGEVAYQLELPESLASVHDVFHVSQLKKCLCVPKEQIPLEELTIKENLTYKEYPVKILETTERVTRSRVIKMCKVQWSRYSEAKATWEREEDLRKHTHSCLSKHHPNLGTRFILREVELQHPKNCLFRNRAKMI
jgi:hypothetical protein